MFYANDLPNHLFMDISFKLMLIKIVVTKVEHFTAIIVCLHFSVLLNKRPVSRQPIFKFMFKIVYTGNDFDRCSVNLVYRLSLLLSRMIQVVLYFDYKYSKLQKIIPNLDDMALTQYIFCS